MSLFETLPDEVLDRLRLFLTKSPYSAHGSAGISTKDMQLIFHCGPMEYTTVFPRLPLMNAIRFECDTKSMIKYPAMDDVDEQIPPDNGNSRSSSWVIPLSGNIFWPLRSYADDALDKSIGGLWSNSFANLASCRVSERLFRSLGQAPHLHTLTFECASPACFDILDDDATGVLLFRTVGANIRILTVAFRERHT